MVVNLARGEVCQHLGWLAAAQGLGSLACSVDDMMPCPSLPRVYAMHTVVQATEQQAGPLTSGLRGWERLLHPNTKTN